MDVVGSTLRILFRVTRVKRKRNVAKNNNFSTTKVTKIVSLGELFRFQKPTTHDKQNSHLGERERKSGKTVIRGGNCEGEGAPENWEFCWLCAFGRGFNFSHQKRRGDSIGPNFKHGEPFAVTCNVSYVSSQRRNEISRWRTCRRCGWILQRDVPRNFSGAWARRRVFRCSSFICTCICAHEGVKVWECEWDATT